MTQPPGSIMPDVHHDGVFSGLHRAGVPHMPDNTTLERAGDWQWMIAAIADLVPLHPAGTESFYHGMTYGWLIGEAVRRTDPQHRPIEMFLRYYFIYNILY